MIAIAVALVVYLPILSAARTAHGLGDVQVFFRAAWAVWTGYPLYQVIDIHGWSYHYPPTFAILMGPFADPLPGYPGLPWALPFSASVGVFYAMSIAAMVLAAHLWAKALEDHSGMRASAEARAAGGRCGSRRCCCSRPISARRSRAASRPRSSSCLPCIFLKLYADRRVAVASAALALAIAIKIFPAALLIIPLLRRDLAHACLDGSLVRASSCSPFRRSCSASIRRSNSIARCGSSGSPASPKAIWRRASRSRSRRGRTTWWRSARCLRARSRRRQPTTPYRLAGMGANAAARFRSRDRRPDRRARPRPLLELVERSAGSPLCDPGRRRGDPRRAAGDAAGRAAALLGAGGTAVRRADRRALAAHEDRRAFDGADRLGSSWHALPISRPGVTLWEPLRNHGPTTLVMLALVAAGLVVLGRAFPTGRQAEAGPVESSTNSV